MLSREWFWSQGASNCIWNAKWLQYCKEQTITLCQQGLKGEETCKLTPLTENQHQPSLRLIQLFSLYSMMSKELTMLQCLQLPCTFQFVWENDAFRSDPCLLCWVQRAAELPQELMSVMISLGLSVALLLNELSICQCLGSMYWELQLVGTSKKQNSLY